jgi:hypothetical protein
MKILLNFWDQFWNWNYLRARPPEQGSPFYLCVDNATEPQWTGTQGCTIHCDARYYSVVDEPQLS